MQKRFLGIDYGQKRVGLALSDPLGIFASGLMTVENKSTKALIVEIQKILTEYAIETVVMGLPIRSQGELGATGLAAKAFGEVLGEKTGVQVIYEDERFTSVIAERSLRAQGVKPSRQKHLTDQTAAALILQQYLDKTSIR